MNGKLEGIREILFPSRADGFAGVLTAVKDDPSLIDRLSSEEFLAIAWWIVGSRGYEVNEWHPMPSGGLYRAFGFNGGTELVSIMECDAGHEPISSSRIRELRQYASQAYRCDTITLISRLVLPPSAILSMGLRSPVELIGRPTILRWVYAAFEADGVPQLVGEYLQTMMEVGTVGLERQEFGRILLPSDFGAQTFSDLATRLDIPLHYSSRLVEVGYFPLNAIRRICQDPRTMHALSPRRFEEFIAELVTQLGFENVELTKFSGDGGRDIVATKRIHGIPIAFFFECKNYAPDNKIQIETLRTLLGVVAHHDRAANVGVLVTSSHFTKGSLELIASEARLDGKDYDGIVNWMMSLQPRV